MNLDDYYVYEYIDPSNPMEPFYVGKGRNGRFRDASQKQRNRHLYNKIQKLRSTGLTMKDLTIFRAQGLSNEEALKLEIEMIGKYGRKDQGRGKLLNYTDGGDGVSGIQPNPMLLPHTNEVIQMYQAGDTAKVIATHFGCNTTAPVYYILKLMNVTRRKSGRKSIVDIQTAIKRYDELKSVRAVAIEIGCDHRHLKRLLEQNNVTVVDARTLVLGNKRGRKKKI